VIHAWFSLHGIGCFDALGYVGNICHVRNYRRCTGCWQSFYSYIFAEYSSCSNNNATDDGLFPCHGEY